MNTLVNFNLAKLLKKKGFDKKTNDYFLEDGIEYSYPKKEDWNLKADTISQPTIAEAVMWLYEKYRIWILTPYSYNEVKPFCWTITTIGEIESDKNCWLSGFDNNNTDGYDSPTEAYESAIEYTLNNLI